MTLEEQIKKMLAEAAAEQDKTVATEKVVAEEVEEVTAEEVVVEAATCDDEEEVVTNPKLDKKKKSKSMVSEQVAAILETEGLSEEFKVQAVTIFEAAVSGRVAQIEEELAAEYEEIFEAEKQELITNIDEYLNEAVQTWIAQNEIAIEKKFKAQVAESFMDGLSQLLAEHNVTIDDDAEDVLEVALNQVDELEESLNSKDEAITALQEEINSLKADKILESYKEKMASTEFDRFTQLVESIQFKDETQYIKQLDIVLENFSVGQKTEKVKEVAIVEAAPVVQQKVVSESVQRYADFIASGKKQVF